MKGDAPYWSLAETLGWLVWGGELLNRENLPDEYPVIFVSNHAAALGPIAVTSSLPIRLYPWVISDMLDWGKAAEYLRLDFVEPQLHVSPPLSSKLSRLISLASVRLLRAIESIPVYRGERLRDTYHISMEYLADGRSLLIFPEDPKGPLNDLFLMRPFKKGFARLGEMYYEKTKRILRFYPLAVNAAARKLKAGKPVSYNPYNNVIKERIRIKCVLESTIHDLYVSTILDDYAGIPLPH